LQKQRRKIQLWYSFIWSNIIKCNKFLVTWIKKIKNFLKNVKVWRHNLQKCDKTMKISWRDFTHYNSKTQTYNLKGRVFKKKMSIWRRKIISWEKKSLFRNKWSKITLWIKIHSRIYKMRSRNYYSKLDLSWANSFLRRIYLYSNSIKIKSGSSLNREISIKFWKIWWINWNLWNRRMSSYEILMIEMWKS
jgi:hypothetical protein